jgi:hypothetical protein
VRTICNAEQRITPHRALAAVIDSLEPMMAPASLAARNTTARAISSGSPSRSMEINVLLATDHRSFVIS